MHYRFIRDSTFGRIVYGLSSHRLFGHQEEDPSYVVPEKYTIGYKAPPGVEVESETENENKNENNALEKTQVESENDPSSSSFSSLKEDEPDHIIADWDGEDDPENPYNWPTYHKVFFAFQIVFLTVSIYMGAAIYTPGIDKIREEFQIGRIKATLPLTLFVFGYGIGPMVFSPMSENVLFGRATIYLATLFIFVILQIPTALSKDIASLCVLRFLSGIFASPALATGGASIGDVFALPYIPVGIATWSLGAVCGPSLGPLIGSVFVQLLNWRWTFWFMLIISGCSFILLLFFFPESHAGTLLHRKALRLRKITGNQRITSAGEIANAQLTARELAIDILWRPIEITLFEPVVLLINIYISLIYAIMYLWFEAFPIVFIGTYHFNLIELGVSYVCILIGIWIGAAIYIPVIYRLFTKKFLEGKGEEVTPESFLPMAIYGSVAMPIGVFIFSWSSSPDTHWIGPMIGAAIFALGAFTIFQTLFNYLSMSFWRFLASVFASNGLFRAFTAGALPLVGAPLFENLGSEKYPVGWGSSILGFICVLMIAIPVTFYIYGPNFRARSKYAGMG